MPTCRLGGASRDGRQRRRARDRAARDDGDARVRRVAALRLGLDLEVVWLALPLASLVTLAAPYGCVRSGRWGRREI